jgi:hypothetical protein
LIVFQFDLAEAWAARLIGPLEAEHQQVDEFTSFLTYHKLMPLFFRLFLL